MRVGELCRLVCTSDYGYGDDGDPPVIPPRCDSNSPNLPPSLPQKP